MSKIVNLNEFREAEGQAGARQTGRRESRLHGRTKAEHAQDTLKQKKLKSRVEQSRLEQSFENERQSKEDDSSDDS